VKKLITTIKQYLKDTSRRQPKETISQQQEGTTDWLATRIVSHVCGVAFAGMFITALLAFTIQSIIGDSVITRSLSDACIVFVLVWAISSVPGLVLLLAEGFVDVINMDKKKDEN
jgi:hypothetical protein